MHLVSEGSYLIWRTYGMQTYLSLEVLDICPWECFKKFVAASERVWLVD